jgi:hypothetical protein
VGDGVDGALALLEAGGGHLGGVFSSVACQLGLFLRWVLVSLGQGKGEGRGY